MLYEELLKNSCDSCDRAEQQKRELFDFAMTQTVRAWILSK